MYKYNGNDASSFLVIHIFFEAGIRFLFCHSIHIILSSRGNGIYLVTFHVLGERTGRGVKALDSESGDPGSSPASTH